MEGLTSSSGRFNQQTAEKVGGLTSSSGRFNQQTAEKVGGLTSSSGLGGRFNQQTVLNFWFSQLL